MKQCQFSVPSPLFKKSISLLLLLFVVTFLSQTEAATYYLDVSAGNDSAAGTSAAPWKSLAKAQSSAASGDTVMLRSGYYGAFSQTKVYSSYVTYKAEAGQNPSMGNIVLGDGSAYFRFDGIKIDGVVDFYGSNYIELLNCTVRYPGDRYAAPANLVDIRHTTYSTVKGCDISHGKTGIKIDNSKEVIVSGNHIHDLAVDVMTATPVVNFLCEGNHAHNIHQDRFRGKDDYTCWPWIPASSLVSVDDRLYYDLKITPSASFTTGLLCYINLQPAMTFQNIGNPNMALSASGTLSSGDLVMRCSTGLNASTSETYVDIPISSSGAVDITPVKSIGVIRSVGLVLKVDRGQITYTINDWSASNGAHQDFCVFSNTTGWVKIRNNIFHDGCNQGIFTSPPVGSNVTVENNLIYDMEGFNLTNLDISGNNVIRNNTFIGYYRGLGYEDPLNKYHLNGILLIVPLDSGSGIECYNNIVGGEISSVGGFNDYNICTRQTTPGPHTLVISGTNPSRINLDTGFFGAVDFKRYHGQTLDYTPVQGSGAINFATSPYPSDSLGVVGPDSFVVSNGAVRDASHHSAGAREFGSASVPSNNPPSIVPIGDRRVSEGANISITVSATDPEGDSITYTARDLPAGASFTNSTFNWTPVYNQLGSYAVTFTATDAKGASSLATVQITVTNGTDIDSSGKVDAKDFAGFAINWLQQGSGLLPDLNSDNKVDFADLYLFSDNWLAGSEEIRLPPMPVGSWLLDESSGTVAADSTGISEEANCVNGPTWGAGHSDGGLVFDGVDDALSISMAKMNAAQGTISVWVKPSGFTANHNYIFGHSMPDWTSRIQLYTNDTGGNLDLGLGDSHSRALNIAQLPLNAWTHIVLTYKSGSYAVYVNGQIKASGTYAGLNSIASNADFGNDGNVRNETFTGTIDESLIFDVALTSDEVASLHSN